MAAFFKKKYSPDKIPDNLKIDVNHMKDNLYYKLGDPKFQREKNRQRSSSQNRDYSPYQAITRKSVANSAMSN